jgi:hypothetical protein
VVSSALLLTKELPHVMAWAAQADDVVRTVA